MKIKFTLVVAAAILIFGLAFLFRFGNVGVDFAWQIAEDGGFLLPIVILSAMIDSINPCAFSILFLTIASLFALGHLRAGILKVGGAYIFGIFVVYTTIGLGILQVLQIFNMPGFMGNVGALILILFGAIGLLGAYVPSFPIKFRIPRAVHGSIAGLIEKGSVPSAFALGGLVGLFEFPCTGGAYLMVLGLLHDHRTFFEGLWYLLIYNVVFVLPLVAVLFVAGNEAVLTKVNSWRKERSQEMRVWSSVLMILLGLLIFVL